MISIDEIIEAHLSINDQSTHWEGCETSHVRCALLHLILRVKELEQAIADRDNALGQKVRTG